MRRAGPDGLRSRRSDLGKRHGGVMRIGRAIIIPVILAFSAAGSIAAAAAAPVAAVAAPAAHAQQVTANGAPRMHYHS